MQFSLPKQRGTNFPEFTAGSISTAVGHVSANGTPLNPKIPRRSLGTRPTNKQYVPIIGNPTHRNQTGKTIAVPSFQPGVPAQKTTLASRKALNKVRLGSILPNKPQIQFKPPRRNVLRPVTEFDLTPENMTKLSIDELIDISGIPRGNDVMVSNTSQVKAFRPSLGRVTNTTSQNGTKKTGEMDSVKSFQAPNEDETTTNKNFEVKRNDGLQVKATGFRVCRSIKGLAVPCKLTQNGAKTINNVSECAIETEPMDRAPKKNGASVSSHHLQFLPRLPPNRLQNGNSSSKDKNTKGEQSRSTALTNISKKVRRQKLELDGVQAVNYRFISKQDGGKQSEVTHGEKNVSKKQLGPFSYNNNGNTCPKGVKGKVYECRQEHCSLDERHPNQDPVASLPQLPPDHLDDMLDIMINMTTGERPTSRTPDPNLTLKNGETQRGTAVERSPLPGFNSVSNANVDLSHTFPGPLPGFNSVPNANVDLSHTFPGMKHLPQSPTGFIPTTDTISVDKSLVQMDNPSNFSPNTTPVFRHRMMTSNVPPPPGLKPVQIPIEVLENITSAKCAKSSAYVDNEKGVGVRGTDDKKLHKLGQSHPTSEEWDIDDWCYVVQWPDGWRATNRDASYLPADVREQLHIDLSQLEGVTPRQPKPAGQLSNRSDHTEASPRVPHEETSRSNGNNNHKPIMSNGSKGKTYTVGGSRNTPPSPKPRSSETFGSSSTTNRQKESNCLTSTDQTMTGPHKVSSRYASDVMISSDSNWSQSTVDWKLDIEELLILLSGPSDDVRTSEFQSVHTSFPSICTEKATFCGVDSNTSVRHSRDDEFLPKHEVKRKYHSNHVVCPTLPNGLDLVELSSTNEVEILFDTLTDVEEDSLEKYLSEGTWTDQEMDFFWRRDFTRNQHLHLTKKNCKVTSVLREGKAVHGRGGGFTDHSDLRGQEECDVRQELGLGNSAAKSVQVHHDEGKSSRNGVGKMKQHTRNHSLASEGYSSTNRLKRKSNELGESLTSLPSPFNDRTKTDSGNWQVHDSREASMPPDGTESQVCVRLHQQSCCTPNQIDKVLQPRTSSADSRDEYAHPQERPTCDSLQQDGTVEQQCVQDTLQNTPEKGDVTERVDSTEKDNLYPPSDCETEQYPPTMNWRSVPNLAEVKKEKIHQRDFENDEKCPLPTKEKGLNADDDVSSTIPYNKYLVESVVNENHAFATCSPRVTQEESKLANWKNAPKQRRHSKPNYDQPLAEVERSSIVHGEDSLKRMAKKVELVTTTSFSSESGYLINGTFSQTVSIEEWMRINDEQLAHAIQMERINGGRPAKQVAPSTNTYQRILRWLKESDFSLIPRKKKAIQTRKTEIQYN